MSSDKDERARLLAFQTLLDGSRNASEPRVELNTLRKLCSRGIPDHPTHLRPLAYSLLFGVLPADKHAWRDSARLQRDKYHVLVKTFMDELETAPPPSEPLSPIDALVVRISRDVERQDLVSLSSRTVKSLSSPLAPPLSDVATAGSLPGAEPTSSSDSAVDEQDDRNDTPARLERRRSRARARVAEPLTSRRALFARISMCNSPNGTPPANGQASYAHAESQAAAAAAAASAAGHVAAPAPVFGGGGDILSDDGDEEMENLLSPRITLSAGGEKPRLAASELQRQAPSQLSAITPSLSLTIATDSNRESAPSSPITLLSPQQISARSSPSPKGFARGSLTLPDTHAEAIARLMYVFSRANPHWAYSPSLVEVAVPLYFVFAQTRFGKGKPNRRGRHAEEETYWALTALMGELGDVVGTPAGDDSKVQWALARLGRRVRWADEQLWNVLCQRNLDPASPLYAYHWLTCLLTDDRVHLLPLWDFIFSQPPSTPDANPKLDLLIDVCTAMIGLCKREIMLPPRASPATSTSGKGHRRGGSRSMWQDGTDGEPLLEDEEPDAAFVRCLQLLREYPTDRVGGVGMILNTAFELQQGRIAAAFDGEDPDAPGWMEARDAAANRTSWATTKLRQAANGASASTGKLWTQYSQSTAAASFAKASTNFQASAMATWANAPSVKGIGAAAGQWLASRRKDDDDRSFSGDEASFFSAPSTPNSTRSALPDPVPTRHSFPAGGHTPSREHQRKRSDSKASDTSHLSVNSLQERLSNLAGSFTVKQPEPQPRSSSGPRPLLLSTSVRKASNPASPGRSRLSSPGSEGGLYRINSTRSTGTRTPVRSSSGDVFAPKSRQGSMSSSTGARSPSGRRRAIRQESTDTTFSNSTYDKFSTSTYDRFSTSTYDSRGTTLGLALSNIPGKGDTMSPPPSAPPVHAPSPLHVNPPTGPSTPQELVTPGSPTEAISIPTPQIAHLTDEDYDHVYEPAEDSFILLDALEADAAMLRDLKPTLCIEIGSGSGICSTFIGSLLGDGEACIISTDINAHAARATLRTGDANDVALNPVLNNLVDALQPRINGAVDLLVFNPPYVETDEAERSLTQDERDIGGAWAGGTHGMAVTNVLLEKLPALLAPGGRFYLVTIHQNKPDEIMARMRAVGLNCKTVMKRRAGRELLSVIRMIRPVRPLSAYSPRRTLHTVPASPDPTVVPAGAASPTLPAHPASAASTPYKAHQHLLNSIPNSPSSRSAASSDGYAAILDAYN